MTTYRNHSRAHHSLRHYAGIQHSLHRIARTTMHLVVRVYVSLARWGQMPRIDANP